MMHLDRENIDRWLFDYTEGNLTNEQEELLEKFLLNNPDLENDLEAWQNATVSSPTFEYKNKEDLKRKRKILPFFLVGSFILTGIILPMFLKDNGYDENLKISKKNLSQNEKVAEENRSSLQNALNHYSNKGITPLQMDKSEENKIKPASSKKYFNELTLSNKAIPEISEFNGIQFSQHNAKQNINDSHKQNLNEPTNRNNKISEVNFSNLEENSIVTLAKTPLNSLKVDKYLLNYDETNDQITSESNSSSLGNLGLKKLLNNVENFVEKDLGLSNIPDHTYALPEYSNIDVLFSNIGATSQVRFQSISSARWLESSEQRKFAQQIAFDGYSRNAQSGFGLQVNYDYFGNGSIQNWNTNLLFSPKIALSKSVSFEPALRFKLGNKIISENRIKNHSFIAYESNEIQQFNFDSSLAIGNKLWYRDLDLGFTINTPYFYFGGQVINILRHQNNIYSNYVNQDMRANNLFNLILGTQYLSRNEKIQFSPYCFYEKSVSQQKVFGGFSLKINKLMIGGSYGTGKITTGTIGLSTRNFALLAQSSYGNSIALNASSFMHQLTIRINSTMNKKSRRYITI